MLWLAASAACDVVISVSLVWFLVKYKRESLSVTDSVATKIMLLVIQTGVITSVAAIVDVITFKVIQKSATIQFIWDFSLSKLYTNSLLSMLNARVQWNKLLDAQNDAVVNISGLSLPARSTDDIHDKENNNNNESKSIGTLVCAPNPDMNTSIDSRSRSTDPTTTFNSNREF
ncbi:hypothetical protein VKT23_015573 [Stygiomarasmius scandens]|uniref:DUF6534 domain-containing protein n=1 Tax=Marasmiellus scandens TaxID=2682957 RepID=A0ABR1IXE3_9AGAR